MLDISEFTKAFKSVSFPTKFHAPLKLYLYLNTHQKNFLAAVWVLYAIYSLHWRKG